MNETNWLPALVVLGLSAAAGLALAARRGAPLPAPTRTHREELLRQKEAAYLLLREHDAARADTPEWRAERAQLEIAAARVLRALDALAETEPAPQARPAASARSAGLVGALWGAGVVAFAGLLAFLISEYSAPRADGALATGGNRPAARPAADPGLDALRAAVAADPTDIASRNLLGHALLSTGAVMDAYTLSEEVLKLDPADAEARTHQGIVLLNMGDLPLAGKVVDRVLAASPAFTEALVWRGVIYLQAGDGPRAVEVWGRAVTLDPSLAATLAPGIAEAGALPAGPLSPAVPPAPLPSGAPAPSPHASATTPSPEDITGRITGDASQLGPGAALFLSARREGATGGPPVWAQRLTPTAFPVEFRIGPADRMLGAETPATLVLTARVDRDGNAATREAGAPEARSDALVPGASNVELRLKEN